MGRTRFFAGFALIEVMIGVAIFAVGILALGRSVENCLNASVLSADEDRVRQVLANRMAEIQATPGTPDAKKQESVDTGYGLVKLSQATTVAELKDDKDREITGINIVTLTVSWTRHGIAQSRTIEFYVYRNS
ncbi:MAG: prepilin-type N-terminal cleavage/methylation domain-containing protein [Verrucomicrobiota bacterium]|nr:prepilin-type N-terminal cleavage/methylation domain-containing protein [Verrucomicrobiota bacterium]